MSDFHKESWSALFDGEATELELRRALAQMSAEEKAQFARYQWMRDALKQSLPESNLSISLVDKVMDVIALEGEPLKASKPLNNSSPAWLKPLIGFATAASFAFVAVLMLAPAEQGLQPAGFIASGNVSSSQLPIQPQLGLSPVSATVNADGIQRQKNLRRLQQQEDLKRIEYYLQADDATSVQQRPIMLPLQETHDE